MKKNTLLYLLLCTYIQVFYSQNNSTNQELFWYGYFVSIPINNLWYMQHEVQERHFINPLAQHQLLFRGHLHKQISKTGWEFSLGGCYFLQKPNIPNDIYNLTVPEIRPHFEFAHKEKIKLFQIEQRYRLEARFYHNTDQLRSTLEDGYFFSNYRFRYRIQLIFPIHTFNEIQEIKLKVSNELHINISKNMALNIFDQNRIYVGISNKITQNITVDIGYLNWFQQTRTGTFFKRDILRFTVFHTIPLKKT